MPNEPSAGHVPPENTYKLYLYLGDKRIRAFSLGPSELQIGKQPDNDVVLEDGAVSHLHCRIFFESGLYKIADLNSRTGTRVNGKMVRAATLRPNDLIRIGPYQLRFVEEGPPTVRSAADPAVRRPAVSRMAPRGRVKGREATEERMSRLAGAVIALARKHPLRALLFSGLCLLFLVTVLSQRSPRLLRRIGIDFSEGGKLGRYRVWLRENTGLELLGKIEDEEDSEKSKHWEGLVESEGDKGDKSSEPTLVPQSKKLRTEMAASRPRLKLIENIVSYKDFKGGYGGKTAAMLAKPGRAGSGGRRDRADCPPGPRTDQPCLVHAQMDDGSERMLIRWTPGAFHKNSWEKLPNDIIKALRDTAAYPEGYIDPEEELRPKPLPTVLSTEESEAMFQAITGLDPQGDIRAGVNPWDQLLKDEKYAQAAMNCPTCPLAARVQSDRGVYYGEKIQ